MEGGGGRAKGGGVAKKKLKGDYTKLKVNMYCMKSMAITFNVYYTQGHYISSSADYSCFNPAYKKTENRLSKKNVLFQGMLIIFFIIRCLFCATASHAKRVASIEAMGYPSALCFF